MTLDNKLYYAWQKERSLVHIRGLCTTLSCLLPLLLIYTLLDWALNLPWVGRIVLISIIASFVSVVVYWRWWRPLRPYNPVRVALQVERCHPNLSSLLISYVQFGPQMSAQPAVSTQLIEALRRDAVDAALPLDFEKIVDFGELKWPYVFVVAAICIFGVACAAQFEYAQTAFIRLLDPSAKYPTRTRIEVLTKKLVVPQGASVELRFRGTRMVPGEGTLKIQFEDGQRDEATLLREEGELFVYRIENARKSFQHSFQLGDALSDEYPVHVVTAPSLKSFKVTLNFPAYTKRAAESQDKTMNVNVLEGTEIQWDLAFDQPLSRMWMRMEKEGESAQVQMSADGNSAIVKWKAQRTTPYRLGWTPKGYNFDFNDELEYTADVKPDDPPQVEITSPGKEEKATVNWKAPIAFKASDDYGLGTAKLIFWKEEGQEQHIDLRNLQGNPATMETLWSLKDTVQNLQVGDVLNYCIEVTDNFPGTKGPHATRSQPQTIGILSVEEYMAWVQTLRQKLNGDLEGILKSEEMDSQGINDVKEKLKR